MTVHRLRTADVADLPEPPAWLDDVPPITGVTTPRRAVLTPTSDPVFHEPLSAFLARVSNAPTPALIEGLLPGDGTAMGHGSPRALKTWSFLEQCLAAASGTAAFGLCAVHAAVPVLYCTNEDGDHRVKQRLEALLRGRGMSEPPKCFHLAVHRGVWLDDLAWREKLIRAAQEFAFRVVVLDPLRTLSAAVDQGPREIQPLGKFCRMLATEGKCVVLLGHHDSKPPAQGRDERQRPHRASGGGLFSHIDAPVHYERTAESPAAALLTPAGWKHSECPPAIEVTLHLTAPLLGSRAGIRRPRKRRTSPFTSRCSSSCVSTQTSPAARSLAARAEVSGPGCAGAPFSPTA